MSRRGDVGSARLSSVSSFLLISLLFFFYSLFFYSPNVEVWAVSIWLKGLLDLFFFFLRPFCLSCFWFLPFFFSLHEVFARLAILFFFFLASPILVRPRSPFGDVIRSLQLRKLGNSRARKKETKGAKNERG